MDIKSFYTEKRRRRVKLIFNPVSGITNTVKMELDDVVSELRAWKFVPEVCMLNHECDLAKVVREALADGIRLFAACGGDGTVSSVAKEIAGTSATLGIIAKGTQNNIALSLGIPEELSASVSILRTGCRIKSDMGTVLCGDTQTSFMEICSAGLMSSLYPSGDDIQHGHWDKIGDFLATLAAYTPSKIKMLLDNRQEIITTGHVILIPNMPYIGRHYQVGADHAYKDGYLDILLFADLSKLDLLGCAYKEGTKIQDLEDPRIQHFRVRKADIDMNPEMQIMADGVVLGQGPIHVEVRRHSLAVIVPGAKQKIAAKPQEEPHIT